MKKIILKCLIMTFIISVGGNFVAMATTLSYTPVTPCKIADTRNTSAGIIDAGTERDFHVYGSGSIIGDQGGDSRGCPSPLGEPHAAHISMVAVTPTGKGNLKAFPKGAASTAGLSINYNAINTNLANAGTVKTITGTGPDISVASNYSSAHVTIQVLGYYYPINFAAVPKTGETRSWHPGDDGDFEKGVQWPVPRFTDNGDGTVTDNLSGLIWLKNANCFGTKHWEAALDVSNKLADGQCGLSDGSSSGDWRLPNIREHLSLKFWSCQTSPNHPGCNQPNNGCSGPFDDVQSFARYWTSTPWWSCSDCPDRSAVTFACRLGDTISEDDVGGSHGVWPVRGGN